VRITTLRIKNDDVYAAVREAVLASLISYGKMYELLHGQLWRKGRVSLVNYSIVIKGRIAKPIRHYDIKSQSRSPYDRDDVNNLGLNQLFAGQSPYSDYNGNPGDSSGIYHDTCQIVPKSVELSSALDNVGWWINGNGSWHKYGPWGSILVNGVSQPFEKTHKDADGKAVSDGWFVTISYPGGYSTDVVLSDYITTDIDGNPITTLAKDLTTESVNYSSLHKDKRFPIEPRIANIPDLTSQHGAIIQEIVTPAIIRPSVSGMRWLSWTTPLSKVNIYADGTCIQFSTPSTWQDRDGTVYPLNGYKTYLPLVYTDTGELVQNRIDFIDNWNDEFELNVVENGYWYTPLISIVVIIVAAVVSYISAGVLSGWTASATTMTLATIGGALGAMGAVTGDKILQVLGALLSIGTTIATIGKTAVLNASLAAGDSLAIATARAVGSSFSEQFGAFVSQVGFANLTELSNLVRIGTSTMSIYNVLSAPDPMQNMAQQVKTTNKMKVYAIDDSNDDETIGYVADMLKV